MTVYIGGVGSIFLSPLYVFYPLQDMHFNRTITTSYRARTHTYYDMYA